RQSGDVVWKQSVDVPFRPAGGGEFHGSGPKSNATYSVGRLFTVSILGTLTAWDARQGQKLWQRNFDDEFGKGYPNWGASGSPIVVGSRVILHFGNDDAGALVALDVQSGEMLWRSGSAGASYSSPLFATIDGTPQIVQWNHLGLVGVDVETGRELWSYSFPHVGSDQNMPTPSIHRGVVLLGGENRGLHAIAPKKRPAGNWIVDAPWHNQNLALDMSSAVINDGFLYGMSHYDKGRLFCVDPKDGTIRWTGPPRTGQNVTFVAADGVIFALLDNGLLRVLQASPDAYNVVAEYRVADGRTWAAPTLLPDGLLIKDHQTLTRWAFSR
ncbi:MAG: PQQ-binding-like beta-propeller repeat protein, partial [Planctomycetota bacterium]